MPRPRPANGKRCPDCGAFKTPQDFYQSEKYAGGLSPYCKLCHRARNNRRWAEAPEQQRAAARDRYHRNKHLHAGKVAAYGRRYRAEQKSSDPAAFRAKKFFDVHRADVADDVTPEYLAHLFRAITRCQCCGKELCLEYRDRETRRYRSDPDAPSIDRVNNHKGYTRSNIAVICWECNFRKTDLTLEDLQMFRKYVENYGDFDVV
jgi:hypothetical protein